MKKLLFIFILGMMVLPSFAALDRADLPESSYYSGTHDRSFDMGGGDTLDIHLEFAVYRDETSSGGVDEAQAMSDWTGHTGADYVYAYQVFCESSSTTALTYFALTGINPAAIASVEDDIWQQDELNSGAFVSGGVQPDDGTGYFNASKTKAIWTFENLTIAQNEKSWFLFLYSDSDWIAGDIEVQLQSDDDIPVPNVPEPATLVFLAGGVLLTFRRRK